MPMEFVFDVPYVNLSGAHFGTGLVSTARGRVALNASATHLTSCAKSS